MALFMRININCRELNQFLENICLYDQSQSILIYGPRGSGKSKVKQKKFLNFIPY